MKKEDQWQFRLENSVRRFFESELIKSARPEKFGSKSFLVIISIAINHENFSFLVILFSDI